jgi:cyclophilin family peptidyl-prolyl cis-trans isomerase
MAKTITDLRQQTKIMLSMAILDQPETEATFFITTKETPC